MKDVFAKLGLHGSSQISISRTRRNVVVSPPATSTTALLAVVLVVAAAVSAIVLRFGGITAVRVRPISEPREVHAPSIGLERTNETHIGDVPSSHGQTSSVPATTTIRPSASEGAGQGSSSEDAAAVAAAVTVVPRAFVPYPHEFPCYLPRPDDQLLRRAWQDRAPATQGLLYEKPNKCASTTLAGVNLRMARNAAKRIRLLQAPPPHGAAPNISLCDVRWSHGARQRAERYRYRNRSRSFLWSAVRDPTSRAVSWYHFKRLSLDGLNHSDTDFKSYVLSQKDHFYLTFLDTRPYTVNTWIDAVAEINFVLGEYDFIGVTERLDESVVVLMLLLGAPMADVLYYSSKVHHGLFARGPGAACYYLQPSVVSDDMRQFFASDAWNNKIRSDAEFYKAVNASLDLTIEGLGRDRVEAELVRFRRAQALVRDRCQGKVRMPCDRPGGTALPVEETDCMVGDVGCGMECLDRVATELGLWT